MGLVEYKSLNIGYCHWFVTWESRTISSNYSPQSLWCDLVLPWWGIGSRAGRGKHWSVTSVMVSLIWSHKDGHLTAALLYSDKTWFSNIDMVARIHQIKQMSNCPDEMCFVLCGAQNILFQVQDVLAVHYLFSTKYQSWDGSAFINA